MSSRQPRERRWGETKAGGEIPATARPAPSIDPPIIPGVWMQPGVGPGQWGHRHTSTGRRRFPRARLMGRIL